MKYTHIVFDLDGTLIDTEKPILTSLQEVIFRWQNKKVPLEDLRFALGIPGEDTLAKLGIAEKEKALSLWDELYQQHIPAVRPFPGIEPLLRELKANALVLGIITSKTKREYRNDFGQMGLSHYFDLVICAEDSIKHKPDPEPMLKYLACSGAHPKEVLYVGDTVYDMRCAQGAGVDSALVLWGCRQPREIQATYYLKEPRELLAVIKNKP